MFHKMEYIELGVTEQLENLPRTRWIKQYCRWKDGVLRLSNGRGYEPLSIKTKCEAIFAYLSKDDYKNCFYLILIEPANPFVRKSGEVYLPFSLRKIQRLLRN